MKAVLLSILPKWCELIANGGKTIELRKTKPKIETPFKCYIYMTKAKWYIDNKNKNHYGYGKVIGEFVCDCIANEKLRKDIGTGINEFYGWHISDLKIYDKPKKLSEFRKSGALSYDDWLYGIYNGTSESTYEKYLLPFTLTRPPQSWCYVEDKGEA